MVAPGTAGALKVGAYALFGSVALFYSDYWCSWYYYYYCYPTTSYAGSYNYGTLLIEAGPGPVHPGPATRDGPPPGTNPPRSTLIWTSATYGVMAGGSSITVASTRLHQGPRLHRPGLRPVALLHEAAMKTLLRSAALALLALLAVPARAETAPCSTRWTPATTGPTSRSGP